MTDLELQKQLKSLREPHWPEEYWEDFPRLVLARLRSSPVKPESTAGWPRQLAWGFAVVAACLVIGFAIGLSRGRNQIDPFALLKNEQTLREILTLFPNRVRAIEQDGRGVQLVLSDQADVPNSTPLWIKICDAKSCQAVVTFSGQQLQLAGEKVEVLADAQGQVLLVGERFVWSSAGANRTAEGHLRIQASSVPLAM